MPQQGLLDLNADKLFEEHGIAEIQETQSQIQLEIERKKEELRNIVGGRYRDLLKAADTITQMRLTTSSIIAHVSQAQSLCLALQGKRLMGFKQPIREARSSLPEDVARFREMKLFLSLLEHMWTGNDKREYLWSAEVYLLARHLYLGLEVLHKQVFQCFPVLAKQWHVINSTKHVVINNATEELKVIQLPYQQTSKCLNCLLLLQVMSVKDLVDYYLKIRLSKLEELLVSDECVSVKQKISVASILLQHTLASLHTCFMSSNGEEGLLLKELKAVTDDQAPPTLSKLCQQTSLTSFAGMNSSQLCANFRPKPVKSVEALGSEALQNSVGAWLQAVTVLLAREVTNLLSLVTDIERVHQIEEEVLALELPRNWSTMSQDLVDDPSWRVYDALMRGHVTTRVLHLVERVWSNAIHDLMTELTGDVDSELRKSRLKQPENDIRWFVWEDSKDQLQLKSSGCTPRVVKLCSLLDTRLARLLADVTGHVGNTGHTSGEPVKEDTVLVYLNQCSVLMVKRLAEAARRHSAVKTKGAELPEGADALIIIRARLLQALSTQCPQLEKCFRTTYPHVRHTDGVAGDATWWSWQQATAFLEGESLALWREWRQVTHIKYHRLMTHHLESSVSLSGLLVSKPVVEVFRIEEQSEDGTPVQSDIRVPSQPSLPLQEYLFRVCQTLNAIAPHTLPRVVYEEIAEAVVSEVVGHYEQLSKADPLYQPQCWQMLMDVRLLSLLLVPQDSKELVKRVGDLSEALQQRVDPFDLSVCYPYLQNTVKKSALRLQGTLGVLINFTEKLPVLNGLKLNTGKGESTESGATKEDHVNDPNVLVMSSSVPWFQLLPISVATGRSKPAATVKEASPKTRPAHPTEARSTDAFSSEKVRSVFSGFLKSFT